MGYLFARLIMHPSPTTLVIATAGHIDHGKTTLIRALTGIDTDRLPEEKRRGITIDLGFASLAIHRPGAAPLCVSFVDVPGHSLFIRNMLAGAGCVPAVLLVVAADEGIKPQTIEHLAICELLGITHGIIAITKTDSVSRDHADEVAANVRTLVGNTFLRDAPLVPVSARTGEGLDHLREQLAQLISRIHAADSGALLRLPIDRAFVLKGFGTVVTGTLLSGTIREGQSLVLEPGSRHVRVRGLQTHGQSEREAQAGTRVAANLSGIDFSEVHRGQTLVAPHTLSPSALIDVEIRLLPTAPPLKHGARVHFHAFTSEVMAAVSIYGYESARPGSVRLARLKLDHPVVLAPGDRFVLRQPSPVATIGGGLILDSYPEPRQRKSATRAWLEQISKASLPAQLVIRIKRRGSAGIHLGALARQAGLTIEATQTYLASSLESGDISVLGADLLVSRDALQAANAALATLIDRFTRKPGTTSIKSSELKNQASLSPEVFDFVVADLSRQGVVQLRGDEISLPSHQGSATRESRQLAMIAQAYDAAGLAAPSVPELAQRLRFSETEMRRLITLLQRQKTIARVGSDDMFMHVGALDALVARVRSLRGSVMDVAAFKQLTGLSRKYAIPLLEYLDRARVTRKQGDQRIIL